MKETSPRSETGPLGGATDAQRSLSPLAGFLRPFRNLRVNLLTAFVLLVLTAISAIMGYSYQAHSGALLSLSDDLIAQTSDAVIEKTVHHIGSAAVTVQAASRFLSGAGYRVSESSELESYLRSALGSYPQLAMLFYGEVEGDFLLQKRAKEPGVVATKTMRRGLPAPSVEWRRRDTRGHILGVERSEVLDYDHRARSWYKGAMHKRGLYWSDVYVFFTGKVPGLTAAHPVTDATGKVVGVVGGDITLGELSRFLSTLTVGRTGLAFVTTASGELVAFPGTASPFTGKGDSLRLRRILELERSWVAASWSEHLRTKQERFSYEHEGRRYLASYRPFPPDFGKDWLIVVVAPEEEFTGAIRDVNRASLLIALVVLLLAMGMALLLARSISRPVERLTGEVLRIKDLDLSGDVDVHSNINEIGSMADAIRSMKVGLRAFEAYVPATLVHRLIARGEEARIGGSKRELTLFFSDIAGFTGLAERLSPEELLRQLSEYLDAVNRILLEERGTLDKFMGDGVMAFWGAPEEDPEQAVNACRAALRCQAELALLNERWQGEGRPALITRIGLHSGPCIVGNLGSAARMSYTAIGDTVNLASRLEGTNKVYGTAIMVSETTYEAARARFFFRPIDRVAVKGRKQPIAIYELVGDREDPDAPALGAQCDAFTQATRLYSEQDWEGALRLFEAILERFPGDRPSELYRERCEHLLRRPPSGVWDAVFRMKSK